jgi:hemerythrin
MPTIKWDSKLSVGNSDIDTEHKLIIAHMNALKLALRYPAEKDYLKFFIDQLHEHTVDHFYHEEQLQLKFRFPHYGENKKGHQVLITELEVIKTIIYSFIEKTEPTQEESKEMSEQVNELMRNWFIDHIIKSDMKMKGYMDKSILYKSDWA